ncbi:MAG: hypothetical protein H6702_08180 [Myxococcales bacterium]|nr:hypothetical protein [Myxococcales bacterium]
MRAPLRALLAQCIVRWLALSAAGATLSVIAGAVEDRPPVLAQMWALATGPALAVAAAWGLQAWRSSHEDVALASLGHAPLVAVVTVAGLAGAAAQLASTPAHSAPALAALTATAARFQTAAGEASLQWIGGGARRPDGTAWTALPAPAPGHAPGRPAGWDPTPAAVALGALWVGLGPRLGPFGATGSAAVLWSAGAALQAMGWT